MGKKVNPRSFRLGYIYNWDGRWLNQKQYKGLLKQDHDLRKFLNSKLKEASIEKIVIERLSNSIKVIIHTSRAGLIIGRGGTGIEELKVQLQKIIQKSLITKNYQLKLEVQEIRDPDTSAQIVAQGVASQIERRMPFRRILKQTLDRVYQNKVIQGIKISVAGRLNGAEMSRTEWLSRGKIPLQTLRADVDFARSTAYTSYGSIGVKVWLYKGEVFGDKKENERIN
ncbi:30S ribosomal protein S3 [bacterium]|mgnify:CR=1 FL=1|nr:30S ribosomal protein S3 [bacterium]|tara:strand:- start:2169 stop:2846 length:678 start_codon:yes stop_codon:yes gene_type:complete